MLVGEIHNRLTGVYSILCIEYYLQFLIVYNLQKHFPHTQR